MTDVVNGLLVKGATVLIGRRSPRRKSYAGLWDIPGGHVEPGETLDDALVRELTEEIGVIASGYSAASQITDPHAVRVIYHIYLVSDWQHEPRLANDEHSELSWFSPKEAMALPDLALDEYRAIFSALQRRSDQPCY
jgi:8-oxo-dGTP diphosphatase